ncbi:alpha/beta hydrolase [Ferrimonas balearica]|uniref:alpha/beta hydrolase n=1 Tax=Ferrimonas balearica TaxID=44012 RepID=UPI001C99B87F|nr:alpha/beta hydrolase [Ferrimonas balearica]MBY5990947.1 alpha/beta fold hydrolase [Ferrimonas balearica]
MTFNYFNQGGLTAGFTAMGRGATGWFSRHLPNLSAQIGTRFLLSPNGKRDTHFDGMEPDAILALHCQLGRVRVNLFGQGQGQRYAVMSHGWADNGQSFQHLVPALVAQGYRVAVIDHIGHGRSEGKRAHLPAFIETMSALITTLEADGGKVELLVGHSMGGVATLNLPAELLSGRQVILIAVPVQFFELMFDAVERLGIARGFLIRVLERVTAGYGIDWQELRAERHLTKLHDNVVFIHDREDRFAPFAHTERFARQAKARMIVTQGLGHRRILGDTGVINHIRELVAA